MLSTCTVLRPGNIEEKTLLTINGDPTIADEFIYVYEKNNFNNDSLYYEADVEDYFDLFVKFKLKVEAAKAAGIDTSQIFIDEYTGYKDQLIKPYLSETKEQERLVEEAYERMKYEVDASHILITVDENASPEDTLKAYQEISDVYAKAKSGENFESLAVRYSQDPSAKSNKGRLGYFSAFQMVFAFENAAYNTPIDSISNITRSKFGYHILKVHDKRPYSGKVKVSHIMITNQNGAVDENTMKNKIFEIHDQIAGGADWNELCQKYSEDQRTKSNGGMLPFIGLRQINDEAFESVAFNLQNPGDISDPVRSRFGWHIIKLEEKQGLQTFDELKEQIEQKISRDDRSQQSKKLVIERLKKQNQFIQDDQVSAEFFSLADSSLLKGEWDPAIADSTLNKSIFSISGKEYNTRTALNYILDKQRRRSNLSPKEYCVELTSNYIEQELLDLEEQQLIDNNRDFRMLLNEYYEGILLFEIMNQKVWGKAVDDSIGLAHYFENHRDNYTWSRRVAASIFESEDINVLDEVKEKLKSPVFQLLHFKIESDKKPDNLSQMNSLVKLFQQYPESSIVMTSGDSVGHILRFLESKNIPSSAIEVKDSGINNIISLQLNSNSKKSLEYLYNQESALTLRVEEGMFEKGDNQLVDSISWEIGCHQVTLNDNYYLIDVEKILEPQQKKLDETKGAVISDYQNYLEEQWLEQLQRTFTLEINNNTLEQIKASFKKKLHSAG